jgi:RimJ/RimL family protein N-acetyltransferase
MDFTPHPVLETDRLVLRSWQNSDLAPYAALNADPEVMRFFPAALDRAASDRHVEALQTRIARTGLGPHAVEEKATGRFIGFVGLSVVEFDIFFKGEVEIGWRLGRASWGKGFAREAATAALRWGFEERKLSEIISFAPTINAPSLAVMKSIGMSRDPAEDFTHPALPADSPLQPLQLYRIQASANRSV